MEGVEDNGRHTLAIHSTVSWLRVRRRRHQELLLYRKERRSDSSSPARQAQYRLSAVCDILCRGTFNECLGTAAHVLDEFLGHQELITLGSTSIVPT